MSSEKAQAGLSFHRLDRAHLAEISALEVEESQLPYFAPTDEIVGEAIRHPDRVPMAIRAAGELVGFFVFRRDRRDPRCWWLAWFMLDRRQQGKGYGKAALRLILAHLARREGCRRIRLQVTPGNDAARRLYLRAGFADTGEQVEGDDVLELAVADTIPAGTVLGAGGAISAEAPRLAGFAAAALGLGPSLRALPAPP